jgi:hypothetical protein
MTQRQESHYRSLPSGYARAAYLVQIHEAADFSEACGLMAKRARGPHSRRVRDTKSEREQFEARARAANYYFD